MIADGLSVMAYLMVFILVQRLLNFTMSKNSTIPLTTATAKRDSTTFKTIAMLANGIVLFLDAPQ